MAVKAIGHGDEMKRRVACDHCRTVLEYRVTDRVMKRIGTMPTNTLFVVCPMCGKATGTEAEWLVVPEPKETW